MSKSTLELSYIQYFYDYAIYINNINNRKLNFDDRHLLLNFLLFCEKN